MQNNKYVGKLTTGDILVINWKAYYTFGEGSEERTYQSDSLSDFASGLLGFT